MTKQFERKIALWGEQAQVKIEKRCVEALVRAGVGKLFLVDSDAFDVTNLNRQLFSTHDTISKLKTQVASERCKSINPNVEVEILNVRFGADTELDFSKFDYVCDCIDTVTSKVELVQRCKQQNVPIICCMGTGNKLDPTAFCVSDVFETTVCPLAKAFRKLLKERNLSDVKVVYSKEIPRKNSSGFVSSCSFVPTVAGSVMAGEVIKFLGGIGD